MSAMFVTTFINDSRLKLIVSQHDEATFTSKVVPDHTFESGTLFSVVFDVTSKRRRFFFSVDGQHGGRLCARIANAMLLTCLPFMLALTALFIWACLLMPVPTPAQRGHQMMDNGDPSVSNQPSAPPL